VVKTSRGKYIELQGTAETEPFDRAQLDTLLQLADKGINALIDKQRELVGRLLG
jgi:ribonuclease PH